MESDLKISKHQRPKYDLANMKKKKGQDHKKEKKQPKDYIDKMC